MIKMLIIAPYEGLKELIQSPNFPNEQFEIKTVVANLEEGVNAAVLGEREGYQMILSRGGTAELIRKKVSIPVISIDISGYDYIRIITLADGFSGKAAMIGYRSITEGAQSIKELMNSSIDIFTIRNSDELPSLLRRLQSENYKVIVGDVITIQEAREMGFTVILLTSGEESVRKAFYDAQKASAWIEQYRSGQLLLEEILDKSPLNYALFDPEGRLLREKLPDRPREYLINELSQQLKAAGDSEIKTFSCQFETEFWRISAFRICSKQFRTHIVFYLSSSSEQKKKPSGISLYTPVRPSDFSISIFGKDSRYLKETYEKVRKFGRLRVPILITGEIGTGKGALAKQIHFYSAKGSSFLTLDGETADRDSVESLSDILSADNAASLYLRSPNLMEPEVRKLLISILASQELTRNRLIITSLCRSPEELVNAGLLPESFVKAFATCRIHLPSLRERAGDMKDLASNYMNEANIQYGKQIASIDGPALNLLSEFHWRGNLDQLRSVIFQLVLLSKDPVIHEDCVAKVLAEESALYSSKTELSKDKTLDDMIGEILDQVIQEENGNLTKVSERLGISRSTIWRRLKQKSN
ncbi:hypothetical protein A7X67_09480 [Clostridium sp. W14A]|nr:hypothetical protein A7X67_09480 [Clostridium sp. W14A]